MTAGLNSCQRLFTVLTYRFAVHLSGTDYIVDTVPFAQVYQI